MGPETLAQVLRPLEGMFPPHQHRELLVGLSVSDDAAVYKISDDVAIIQTLDFFPPVVDEAYDYGAIAAANSMSDIYAMGGQVALALNIAAFPADMSPAVISEILRGGAEKVAEAGGVLAGGHTTEDREPKYGLAVMGLIHPDHVLTKAGARPGDKLVLTKPLGAGIITTALKGEVADPVHVQLAVQSMKRLNNTAARLIQETGVNASTDITGFGVLGHSYEMAEKSGVKLRLYLDQLPFLNGAKRYADEWLFPGGSHTNQGFYERHISWVGTYSEETRLLLYTPETSGGLLVSVSPERLDDLLARFAAADEAVWVIGEVLKAGVGLEIAR
jgi:selenide,water dikinase